MEYISVAIDKPKKEGLFKVLIFEERNPLESIVWFALYLPDLNIFTVADYSKTKYPYPVELRVTHWLDEGELVIPIKESVDVGINLFKRN